MTDQPNQLDLTTATPDQVEHMIWHLTKQYNLFMVQHAFLVSNDPFSDTITEINETISYIEAELDILEKHQRLICN